MVRANVPSFSSQLLLWWPLDGILEGISPVRTLCWKYQGLPPRALG